MSARNITRPSVASLALVMQFQRTPLASATGFIAEHNGRRYLITNWHVVSGKRPDNGAVLSATGGLPDEVLIWHNQAGALGNWIAKVERLLETDGTPRWLEHPNFGRNVDVVALELSEVDGVDVYAHDPWNAGPGLAVGVATSLSIVGFPFGISGGGKLGIWVQGSVATEPTVDFNGLPCFLVDSRTRSGQSGSPVIAYHAGGAAAMQDGGVTLGTGVMEQFVGVYSGRISDQSDLGHVWKAAVVRDIVERGVRGIR